MILLFPVAVGPGRGSQSFHAPSPVLCPPAPQVPGPADGLQGTGHAASLDHQLAGEEEQGVQRAEGCGPHLTFDPRPGAALL